MADNTYDAIVIGSGIAGGWAAKRICKPSAALVLSGTISPSLTAADTHAGAKKFSELHRHK